MCRSQETGCVIGTALVKEKFELTNLSQRHRKEGMSKHTAVAGSKVSSGEARASGNVRVLRDGAEVHDGKVVSLKRFKDEVRAVRTGQECGIVLHDYGDFEVDDVLSFYEVVPRKPGLYDALEADE